LTTDSHDNFAELWTVTSNVFLHCY